MAVEYPNAEPIRSSAPKYFLKGTGNSREMYRPNGEPSWTGVIREDEWVAVEAESFTAKLDYATNSWKYDSSGQEKTFYGVELNQGKITYVDNADIVWGDAKMRVRPLGAVKFTEETGGVFKPSGVGSSPQRWEAEKVILHKDTLAAKKNKVVSGKYVLKDYAWTPDTGTQANSIDFYGIEEADQKILWMASYDFVWVNAIGYKGCQP